MKCGHLKSPHQKLCNSPMIHIIFFSRKYFFFALKKKNLLSFLSKMNKINLATKKQNYLPNLWTILLVVMWRSLK